MAANVKFFIFAHGNILYGEEGASYDREPLRKIRVKTDANYEDLLHAICTKVDIDPLAHQIKVLHRHPKSVGERVHHYLVPIQDDSDVEELTEMAEKMGDGSIQELYLEISNRSVGLSEHETRQVDATIPLTTQVPRSKHDPSIGDENSMCRRAGFDIDSSKELNNIKQEINRAPVDSPTETGENLVIADFKSEDPCPPCPKSTTVVADGMEEGNQISGAGSSKQNYEVFLSFRGEDTRHGFVDHLYGGLVNVGVRAFRDNEELRIGKEIGPELLKAIKGSKISIPIISKNYASSPWCLMELAQILKCMKTSGQIVLPILYQVAPSDVRNQRGCFGNGFSQCKKKHDAESKLVQEWENALREVTTLKVWESEKIGNGYEAELLQKVVNEVQEVLGKRTLRVSTHLVGVESHVEKIIEQMKNAKGSGNVQAIVVHGMGGIGKTTLAKVVYNRLYNHFEGCSFIADIREASQHNGIKKLQKQLILDISRQQKYVHNIDEGADTIKARCERKKVLILLDDVDHRDQLNAFAGEPNWFGRGSVIIITTRNKDVLEKWESAFYYELVSLDPNQSFILFCKHAFKESDSCSEDYGTLANDIARTTAGLPLAIEIIGSFLHGKEKYVWEDTLKMLEETPHDDVHRILKISFDALHPEEKEIFLDIACLPIRKDKKLAIYMWEGCAFSRQRINNLISKSMIKYGEGNEIHIHDQLRDFGREIVRGKSIAYLGNRSRIWKDKDAKQVLESKQGTPNIQALVLQTPRDDPVILPYKNEDFVGMTNLRFLRMDRVHLVGDFENHFQSLKWLEWSFYGHPLDFDIMGINLSPRNLVVLKLDGSNITENWKGWSQMKHLKVVDLFRCNYLTTTPDFSAFKKLEVLTLLGCGNLKQIHRSIGNLSKTLKQLTLDGCCELEELPIEMGKMEELRELNISCTKIREIPVSEGYLTKLEKFVCCGCNQISSFNLDSLSSLVKLQCLRLQGHKLLTKIPESIGKLRSLMELYLPYSGVKELPDSMGELCNLESLVMTDNPIKHLPTSIGKLSNLRELTLSRCMELEILPDLPPSLTSLEVGGCKKLGKFPHQPGVDDKFGTTSAKSYYMRLLMSIYRKGALEVV